MLLSGFGIQGNLVLIKLVGKCFSLIFFQKESEYNLYYWYFKAIFNNNGLKNMGLFPLWNRNISSAFLLGMMLSWESPLIVLKNACLSILIKCSVNTMVGFIKLSFWQIIEIIFISVYVNNYITFCNLEIFFLLEFSLLFLALIVKLECM